MRDFNKEVCAALDKVRYNDDVVVILSSLRAKHIKLLCCIAKIDRAFRAYAGYTIAMLVRSCRENTRQTCQ